MKFVHMFMHTEESSFVFSILTGLLSFPFSRTNAAWIHSYYTDILVEHTAYSEDQETVYSAIFLKYNTHPCILKEEWFA